MKNKFYLDKIQLKTINKKNVIVKMTRQELIKRLIEAKTRDWTIKHPEPPKDLFYDEFKADWDKQLNTKRNIITEKVYAHYCNKIILKVRYIENGKYTPYKQYKTLKDKYGEVTKSTRIPTLDHNSYLIKKTLNIISKNTNKNVIAYQLLCTNLKTGRLIIP